EHTPAEIKENFAQLTTKEKPGGLARVIKTHERFTDHLIHQQDIRRPMNKPREIPRERLVAALDALPRIGGFLKSNQKAKGLRFVATDIDYTLGDGPEVRGPAESLILAISGRPVALPELEGEGLATLRERVGA
ncbi:MAG TPA: DinB family protein, partial [Acidimicrobiia bacterium]|nr:DinB family protein [Acidimicrobiia bacterium]